MRAYSKNVFCSTAFGKVRIANMGKNQFAFGLGDGLPPLFDFRFADDTLIFASSSFEIIILLYELVQFLGDAGLKWNAEKTVLITPQTQPPPPLLTTSTLTFIKLKER